MNALSAMKYPDETQPRVVRLLSGNAASIDGKARATKPASRMTRTTVADPTMSAAHARAGTGGGPVTSALLTAWLIPANFSMVFDHGARLGRFRSQQTGDSAGSSPALCRIARRWGAVRAGQRCLPGAAPRGCLDRLARSGDVLVTARLEPPTPARGSPRRGRSHRGPGSTSASHPARQRPARTRSISPAGLPGVHAAARWPSSGRSSSRSRIS